MSGESTTEYKGPSLRGRALNHLMSYGWTPLELEEAFNIPAIAILEETEKCQRKVHGNSWSRWQEQNIIAAIRNFIAREGRWPNLKDFRQKNDMPSMQMVQWRIRRQGAWGSPSGWERAQQIIVTSRKYPQPINILLTTPNITIRRQAIERIGFKKLIKVGAVIKISEDDFGILWRLPQSGDEDMMFAEVVNSTPEPNGTYAHYFLRVPPTMTTPQQAVAWTFGVPTDSEWENFKIEVAT